MSTRYECTQRKCGRCHHNNEGRDIIKCSKCKDDKKNGTSLQKLRCDWTCTIAGKTTPPSADMARGSGLLTRVDYFVQVLRKDRDPFVRGDQWKCIDLLSKKGQHFVFDIRHQLISIGIIILYIFRLFKQRVQSPKICFSVDCMLVS